MPVEETLDADLGTTTTNLDQLDKMSAKAVKQLEKQRKALDAVGKQQEIGGGIFKGPDIPTGRGAPLDIAKNSKKLKEIIDERIKEQFKESLADQAGGVKGADTIFSIGKNPKAFAIGVLKSIPFLGGIVAGSEFAEALVVELEKIDRFFKKFIDIIDNRVNQLRDKVEIAHIRAGDIQEIYTTQAGGTEPRESYNTFNEFNKNRVKLEADFAVRDKSGI